MSDRRVSLILAFIVPLIFLIIGPYSAIDLAGWVAYGQYFLDHHELLRSDIYSVLPTQTMVYPAWGISVVYALIYRWSGGLMPVSIFHYAVVLMILLGLIYRKSIFLIVNPASNVARLSLYVFWLGAAASLGERPSMVALIPLVLAYLTILKIERLSDLKPKVIAYLCIVNVFWVNIHGSFILLWLMFVWKTGMLTISEWDNPQKNRLLGRLLVGNLALGLSALLNPFSYHVFPYILETVLRSRGRMISEWEPTLPYVHFPTGVLYYGVCAIALVIILRRWGKSGFWSFLSSPFFFLLINGASAIRNAALPFVVLLPTMVKMGYLDTQVGGQKEVNTPRASKILKLGFFVGALILVSPAVKPQVSSILPIHRRELYDNTAVFKIADTILHSGKKCPVFNGWETGSFLLLTLPNKIFFDSRNIIYPDEQFKEYLAASLAQPGWEKYLDRYAACFAVLGKSFNASLISVMQRHKDWKFIMEENDNFLFEKSI